MHRKSGNIWMRHNTYDNSWYDLLLFHKYHWIIESILFLSIILGHVNGQFREFIKKSF